MSDRVQVKHRMNRAVKEAFVEWVESEISDVEGATGREMERAFLEYMPDEISDDLVDRPGVAAPHPHRDESGGGERETDGSVGMGKKSMETTKTIAHQVQVAADGAPNVHESVVINTIEEEAGGAYKTIRKYKRALKRRRLLFEHPTNDRWYVDEEDYIKHLRDYHVGRGTLVWDDVITEEEYGSGAIEWADEVLDRLEDDGSADPTFQ